MTTVRLSHPDPQGPPDRTPIEIGEVWENPVTGERAKIVQRPWDNQARRGTAELTALVGARVMGEHLHPALVEKFTVLEGELTVKRDGKISILRLVFRSPPPALQRALFGALGLVARWRGYRGTYPQLSRMVLAPRRSAS